MVQQEKKTLLPELSNYRTVWENKLPFGRLTYCPFFFANPKALLKILNYKEDAFSVSHSFTFESNTSEILPFFYFHPSNISAISDLRHARQYCCSRSDVCSLFRLNNHRRYHILRSHLCEQNH